MGEGHRSWAEELQNQNRGLSDAGAQGPSEASTPTQPDKPSRAKAQGELEPRQRLIMQPWGLCSVALS